MDTLIHADIFFFVTTIAVVVVGIALTVLIVYLVKVLRSVRKITDMVGDETVLLRHDISDLRSEIRARGARAVGAMDWFERFFGEAKKSRSKKKSK
jgi:hypothetical protein